MSYFKNSNIGVAEILNTFRWQSEPTCDYRETRFL